MDAHLLFAAEQYAAAQASAAAAAQYYASAAMTAAAGGGPSGAVLLPPGTLVMSQPAAGPQLVSLPPSHTWSGAPGPGQLPPAPPPPQYSGQDLEAAREREQWDEQRRRRDRSRERRHRRQRSRSRSRSQEPESRDRRRRRDRSRSWSRGRDPEEDYREPSRERSSRWSPRRSRDRDRSPGSRRFRAESPGSETEDWRAVPGNDTIMIRGLPLHVTEQHVQDNIMSHGLEARDIRLIRKKDTGASRGFAFVEFSSVEDARKWIEAQQGWLTFSGSRVSMQFSVPRDQRAFEQPRVQSDWICAKCGVQNFRRRDACFKCNAPRSEYDSAQVNDETDEVSTHPTNTVLLSGLDALTTEDSVLNVLGPLTKLPLKNVKVGRDPLTSMSRGVCYVEMNSVVDAMFLHNQLIAAPPAIDGKTAEVSYHKQAGPGQVASSSQQQAAAHSAMAAAQWTNKSGPGGASKRWSERELSVMAEYSAEMYAKTEEERRYYVEYYTKYYREGGDTTAAEVALSEDGKGDSQAKEKKVGSELGVVVVEGVEYKKYPTPDTSKYQYDDTSGYYYDPVSTLYYDANSQYYYNSKTSKFYYWDHRHETFLPAPSSGTEKKEEEKKVSSKEKVKSAKKIQKDMEKWAKTLNQRKDQSRAPVDVPTAANGGGSGGKGSEDIAFNVLQRKDEAAGPGLAGLAGYGSDEEEEDKAGAGAGAGAGMAVAEMKLTDWAGLACLLCQRQFKSRDQLTKHNTMSELHTANMRSWRAQYTDPGEAGAGGQYRDRAKERRNKFGDDDKPIPNRFKEKFLKALDTSSSIASASGSGDLASAPKLTDNNIGNKMLQKMGWKDGQGLGKKKQGRTDIIIAQQRTQGVGLGTEQAAINPAANYKETAKTAIWARYNRADRECDY